MATQRIIIGSTSDEAKIIPGIERFCERHPEEGVVLHYASADNTPGKVRNFISTHSVDLPEGVFVPEVWISGAGMSNVLTGVIKAASNFYDLNIGIPITDESTEGLASVFSTSEKPPRNPVLSTTLNNSYSALNISHRFSQGLVDVVVPAPFLDEASIKFGCGKKLTEALTKAGLPFTIREYEDIDADSVVVSPVYPRTSSTIVHPLQIVDSILSNGKGVQVGVYASPPHKDFTSYLDLFRSQYATTGFVSSEGYVNAVLMAAILTKNKPVLEKIRAERNAKVNELEAKLPRHFGGKI